MKVIKETITYCTATITVNDIIDMLKEKGHIGKRNYDELGATNEDSCGNSINKKPITVTWKEYHTDQAKG